MPLGAFKAALMGTAGVSTGDVVLLSSQTASNSATISFTSDITSTYGEYIFKFYNINPATDDVEFTFNGSIDGGSNYNVTKTTTRFSAYHREDDGDTGFGYHAAGDLAQSADFHKLLGGAGNAADEGGAGEVHLFNPSSTTYVKHFYSTTQQGDNGGLAVNAFIGGYFNNTDNIDAVQFKMSSGNFDGVIQMYGIA